MLWQLVAVIALLWTYLYQRQKMKQLSAAASLIPDIGYTSYPIVGQLFVMKGSDEQRMSVIRDFGKDTCKVGGISKLWFGNVVLTIVTDAEAAAVILRSCLQKSHLMNTLRSLIGHSILIADTSTWTPRRKMMNPSFALSNLNQFSGVISGCIQELIENLEPEVGDGDFGIWNYLQLFTMDTVFETNLGIKVNAQKNPDNPFIVAFEEATALVSDRILAGYLPNFIYKCTPSYRRLMRANAVCHEILKDVVQKKREELMNRKLYKDINVCSTAFRPLMESLMEASGGQIEDGELIDEMLLVAIAGTDTSALGTGYTLRMLAKYPDEQQKVYDEIVSVLGDTPPTTKDVSNMKYLDAVIRESIRLYPPVPMVIRHIDKTIKMPNGTTLARDMETIVNIYSINRNPKYWGADSQMFVPDRFFRTGSLLPAAFVAFSFGPRNCIGHQYAMMLMKMTVASLLQKYKVLPPKFDEVLQDPSMSPSDPGIEDNAFRARYNIMVFHRQMERI